MFERLFGLFSRRNDKKTLNECKPLTVTFKNRVIMVLQDHLGMGFEDSMSSLHREVAMSLGLHRLSHTGKPQSTCEDLIQYMFECEDDKFFDILELLFHSRVSGITYPDSPLIKAINQFLQLDELPYHLTDYVVVEGVTEHWGRESKTMKITGTPQIIMKNNDVIHHRCIEPTLNLLSSDIRFQQANDEFLNALEDFRNSDYRDCLTKCCSAFESTMKVLCSINSIAFKQTDSASPLLKSLIEKSDLDSFWEQPLILIATIRNRLSSSHGAGTQEKQVSKQVANYTINATAAAILLLVEEWA
ncbi:DUF7014 domain-containing protein [Planctobacterium marinum]|uniref:DUF7014 domain-containing protein n=1 Tax=Planctobacterium marinum TaxID=1631968 RepID=UPI002B4C15FF|nr:hypothetical protein [Planctobacterium marinum]MCC2606574.1 hypothetical protein [Planctobacterium marinum]